MESENQENSAASHPTPIDEQSVWVEQWAEVLMAIATAHLRDLDRKSEQHGSYEIYKKARKEIDQIWILFASKKNVDQKFRVEATHALQRFQDQLCTVKPRQEILKIAHGPKINRRLSAYILMAIEKAKGSRVVVDRVGQALMGVESHLKLEFGDEDYLRAKLPTVNLNDRWERAVKENLIEGLANDAEFMIGVDFETLA
jgi:hypothetical protein